MVHVDILNSEINIWSVLGGLKYNNSLLIMHIDLHDSHRELVYLFIYLKLLRQWHYFNNFSILLWHPEILISVQHFIAGVILKEL